MLQILYSGDVATRLYKSSNEPFVGIYSILRPMLLVRDPELIQTILIKDFANFSDRDVHFNESYDPVSAHLFSLPGQRWKNLRTKLSPAFTQNKLKGMFSTFMDCKSKLQNHMEQLADNGDLLDVREVIASHTTNLIANVGFGIEVDTISDPNNELRVCCRQIFEPNLMNGIRWFLFFFAPKVMSFFRLRFLNNYCDGFIRTVVKENLKYREENNVIRKDYFNMLVQLRNTGTVQLDDQWETTVKTDVKHKLTINEMAAQSFLFFAGVETSSTTLSFCLYELAKHPEIQERAYNEIEKTLEQYGGSITFESVSNMKYLELCMEGSE